MLLRKKEKKREKEKENGYTSPVCLMSTYGLVRAEQLPTLHSEASAPHTRVVRFVSYPHARLPLLLQSVGQLQTRSIYSATAAQ